MSPRVARALHRTGRVALSVTALVGVVCALLTVLALVTGVRPLVFRSGSMGPDVPAGSLGFSRSTDAADLKVGDVVTVTTKTDQKVTHRIVTVTPHDDVATLQLKGDANSIADEDLYQVSSAPKLLFSVPQAGYTVNWLSHAPGSYVLALYVALMLALIARRKDAGTSSGTPAGTPEPTQPLVPTRAYLRPPVFSEGALVTQAEPRGRGPRRALVAGVVVALVAVGLTGFSSSTWATWTDTADVSGSTIASGTWVVAPPAAPVVTSCTRSGNSITLNWTASVDPTNFRITHTNPTTEPLLAGNLRTATTQNANFNNSTGTIWIVAINSAGTSPASNKYAYTGNGSNATCTPVP